MNDLLFLDPRTGERRAYGELWRRVREMASAPGARAPLTLVAPAPGAAVSALAEAALLGRPLVLLDEGVSVPANQATASTADAPRVPPDDFEAALQAARDGGGFSLTLHTSGTTGKPRAVTHRMQGLLRALRAGPHHAGDVWGLAYDPTHIAGVQVIFQALFNRNPLVRLFGGDPAEVAWSIAHHGVTHLSATPSFYRLLMAAGRTFPGVRAVTLGGERSDSTLLARLAEAFPGARIRNLYASTEAGTVLSSEGDVFSVPENLAARVRVRDGALELHRSLLGDFAGTAPAVGEWYGTGDVVEVLGEAPLRFRFLNREQEWVNVGGVKVNPAEAEDALLACPGVREARVYGRANSVLGQVLCADVVAEAGFDEAAVRERLGERLPPAKVPRLIRAVAGLPRTRSGKIARAPVVSTHSLP